MTDEELDNLEDDINNDSVVPENAPPEEKSFAKRYGDLRRHAAKKEADLKRELEEANRKLTEVSAKGMELPTNEADIEEWVKKYPDVSKIVIGIARQQAKTVTSELDERVQKLNERDERISKAEAEQALATKHPDFFTVIRTSEDFINWLEEQDDDTKDAMYNGNDARKASRVISDYKYETNYQAPKEPKKDARKDVVRDVPVRGQTYPAGGKQTKFTESQVDKMSSAEYEKNEEAINKAIASGEFVYDLSGGAR